MEEKEVKKRKEENFLHLKIEFNNNKILFKMT